CYPAHSSACPPRDESAWGTPHLRGESRRVCSRAGLPRGSHRMIAGIVLLFLIIVFFGYTILVYNGLVRVRAEVKLTWANIDVLLVQRHDELPKLVEVCKGYMKYEADTLERVMRA